MESPTRRNQLGKRSIIAEIGAVIAIAACGVAIYLVVMSFTENSDSDSKNDKKGRSEQKSDKKASAATYLVAGRVITLR